MPASEYQHQYERLTQAAVELEEKASQCVAVARSIRALLAVLDDPQDPDTAEGADTVEFSGHADAQHAFSAAADLVRESGAEVDEIAVLLHDGQTEENMPEGIRAAIAQFFPGARLVFRTEQEEGHSLVHEMLRKFTDGHRGRHERPEPRPGFDPTLN